jgi:glycosyltransferase involved in cell wall biosynthesis
MTEADISRPLYWAFEPASIQHLPHLPPAPVIYDCIDRWAGYFPEGSRRHRTVSDMDRRLAARADLIFVGSEALRTLHSGHSAPVHLQHHAADFALFNRAADPSYPMAASVAALRRSGRRIVGLCGILDKRVDVASLARIAERRRDWELVLVGPVQRNLDVGALASLENVTMVGPVEAPDLPAHIRGFDVCLIPYLIDEFVRGIYPLKLHEYLATGRPVVATPIPAVLPYADRIEIAEGADGIEAAIERALADDASERVAARIALARRNGWDTRVAEKLRIAREALRQ